MLNERRACRGLRLMGLGSIALSSAGMLAMVCMLAGCDNQGGASVSTASNAEPGTPTTASAPQSAPAVSQGQPQTQPSSNTGAADQSITAQSQAPVLGDVPPVKLDPPTIDFGFLEPTKNVTGVINIQNTGRAPLKILSTKAGCKCTTLDEMAGKVIPPGQSIPMRAVLETGMAPGLKKSSITLVIEGYTRPMHADIRGEVTLPIRIVPQFINLVARGPDGGTSETLQGIITIESIDQAPFRVISADGREPQYVGFDPAIDEARNSYQLRWDLAESVKNCDTMRGFWCVVTDHPKCPIVDARVRHACTTPKGTAQRGWRIDGSRLFLGHIRRGEPVEATFTISKLIGQEIYQVSPLSTGIDAELVAVDISGEDATCQVRITPKADLPNGLMYEVINVYATNSYAELPVVANLSDAPSLSSSR